MNPPISIVVIGYNIEKYIGECLSSAIQQHYDNFEVIYVDDGSKDSTLKIARDYAADKENMIVVEKANGGIISAKIEGVKRATGDFLCFVDGDDWVGPELLAHLCKGIEISGEKADIVEGKYYVQRKDGFLAKAKSNVQEAVMTGDSYFRAVMEDRIAHYTVAKLYNKQFLLKAGYLDFPHVTMAEDLLTNSLLGLNCPRVHFLDCADYYYRYVASSLTHAGDARLLEQSKTLKHMEKRISEIDKYHEQMEYQWFSYLNAYLHTQGMSADIKKQLTSLCRDHYGKWTKNKYSIKRWKRMSLYNKLRLLIYLYFPILIYPYESVLNIGYRILRA